MNGVHFGIITDQRRPEKLTHLLDSIAALEIPEHDIRIEIDHQHEGRLGDLRNRAARNSIYDTLIICDDDIYLDQDFYTALLSYGDRWDILLPRLLNPDGSRLWDWAEHGGPNGHRMLSYDAPDNGFIVPTGGCVILKRAVFERVQWNETMRINEGIGEDYDYGVRLHAAGYKMTSGYRCIVHHDDPRYHQIGQVVWKEGA